jgi:hypothetical protein
VAVVLSHDGKRSKTTVREAYKMSFARMGKVVVGENIVVAQGERVLRFGDERRIYCGLIVNVEGRENILTIDENDAIVFKHLSPSFMWDFKPLAPKEVERRKEYRDALDSACKKLNPAQFEGLPMVARVVIEAFLSTKPV